ncbi:hypothetical protein F4810DRAFT_695256 [Camillea tinctor]|nr:hypothetical protein F4810DRAFT_695256 [Camillea tinctor]
MLLRQLLKQPLSRSVATAAAAAATWRPPTCALLLNRSYSSNPPFGNNDNSDAGASAGNDDSSGIYKSAGESEEKNAPSLFEQLFPEEAREQQRLLRSAEDGEKNRGWISQIFEQPTSLKDLETNAPDDDTTETTTAQDGNSEDEYAKTPNSPLRARSMLILTAASKHLLESDFMRIGHKGKHIEDWVAGIVKVIQARDIDTLEPLGHYFILFDHPSAARAYKAEFERLWLLSKQHVPGARRHKQSAKQQAAVPGSGVLTTQGEDIGSLLRAFTLVPPSQRHRLVLDERRFPSAGSTVEALDRGGSLVERLARRAGSRFLVLVSVEGGRISPDTLRRAIEDDGEDRHLAWRVRGHEDGGGAIPHDAILPFGSSIVKARDVDQERHLREQGERAGGVGNATAATDDENVDDGSSSDSGNPGGTLVLDEHDRKYRRYPRFIVPFEDAAEAHRFVRCWHRRQMTLRMDHDDGHGRVSKFISGLGVTWEESRIINATLMW